MVRALNRHLTVSKCNSADMFLDLRRPFLRTLSRRLNSKGSYFWRRGDLPGAERFFRLAIAKNRRNAAAHSNLGSVLLDLHRYDEGMVLLEQAVRLDPEDSGVLVNLGNAYHRSGRTALAVKTYSLALEVDQECPEALANILRPLMEFCEWPVLEAHFRRLRERMELGDEKVFRTVSPFNSVFLPFSRAEQLAIARRAADEWDTVAVSRRGNLRQVAAGHGRGKRLRIGYLSSDFHDHATAHLTAGIYGFHDRNRFEVFAYSLGYPDGSEYRLRIASGCDVFADVHELGAADIAKRIAADRIDILVDMKGYTGGGRPAVLALRPAPLQVSYLGYPGTMGAQFIDYLVADHEIIPESHLADYSERVVFMPLSYQATDGCQAIDEAPVSRSHVGLPPGGFVYCCFNTSAKIDQRTFKCWLRILASVPGSVLWLLKPAQECMDNLRNVLIAHGFSPERLIYAPILPKPQHLARLRLADLFLDTFVCNAHTTATDALWAGVPVLTLRGHTFASRVASSLASAVGLRNLVAASEEEYVDLAIRLALDGAPLAHARQVLGQGKALPLFDTPQYVRDLESAYLTMVEDSAGRTRASR